MAHRRKNNTPVVKWKIAVPHDIAAAVEIELWDPLLKKPRYGSRGAYIVMLIQRDLEAKRQAKAQEQPDGR